LEGIWLAEYAKKMPLLQGRHDAICLKRPHVSLTGLDLAPLWKRLPSGHQARSFTLLYMIIFMKKGYELKI